MFNENEAKSKIQLLIEKYEAAKHAGQIKKYTEEDTKKDFILPLFEALGWNINNRNEVSSEEHIKSSGRVDYGFYFNGRPKFYLEAKPLKADIHKEEYANQAIKYSWNKGVTWAVLTDFESVIIFNTQDIKQSLAGKKLFEIPYSQFIERFDQLSLLSKSAFEEDLINREAERIGKKFQRVPVNELLFKDLNECREILTKALSGWNESFKGDLLDEGIQRLLDRLIFLRVAEDRGIEPPTLIPLLREWESRQDKDKMPLYKSMIKKFRELDKTYNSNLFSEHPFENWEEYDGATEKVINILYGKKGYYEYDFKVIPADILGNVYENYLGYKLSQSKKANLFGDKDIKISKDSRKRKEQGIYYTPAYIVDYIVENALKPILDKCDSIDDLKKVKVLDPACGSGSFLIKALDLIYEKYRKFGDRGRPIFTKIQILSENIYGVDLDAQAVEIARLNLLINSLDSKFKLPLLSNIKQGNSLISGTDEELKKQFGANFRDKKPFNWEEEFPEVFKQGGFDVVIGNPPYIFARGGNFDKNEKAYYYDNYKLQEYQINTYLLFIERAFNLLRKDGYFGFIVPNNWLTINSFRKLREFLLKNTGELKIINAIDAVFSHASVDTCILVFKKESPTTIQLGELTDEEILKTHDYKAVNFYQNDFIIDIRKSSKKDNFLNKFIDCIPIGEIATVSTGLKAYQKDKGRPPQTEEIKRSRIFHSKKKSNKTYLPYLAGVDVKRYRLDWSEEYLSYGDWLAEPRKSVPFSGKRILVRQIPSPYPHCINAAFTEENYLNDINSMIIFKINDEFDFKYILGLINSKLISYWFFHTFNKFSRKIFPQFKVNELAKFPIYPANRAHQKTIIELVDKILDLNKQLKSLEENSNQWSEIKSEIEKTDKKIDEEVYKLYGLTPEEIKIVENQN